MAASPEETVNVRSAAGELYRQVDSHFREMTASDEGLHALIACEPGRLPSTVWQGLEARYASIVAYQRESIDVFRASLDGDIDPSIASLFFRDVPPCVGPEFHRSLPRCLFTPPLFFRTDEPEIGKIAEIQAPGSGWGEYELLRWSYEQNGCDLRIPELAAGFNASLRQVVAQPVIHHMIDQASVPAGNMYFINASRRAVEAPRYWGYDRDLKLQDCNVVRTHQYLELHADNLFRMRQRLAAEGKIRYDHPLICIFEQKLAMALPFVATTHQYYSDATRELFPYTTLLLPTGLVLEHDRTLSLDEFCDLPPRSRPYVIKYAGFDATRNWGSRAVYFAAELTNPHLRALLNDIVAEFTNGGGCWILQRVSLTEGDVEAHDPSGRTVYLEGYVKHSGFYGPRGLLGVNAMWNRRKKVHGQADTVMTVAAPEPSDP